VVVTNDGMEPPCRAVEGGDPESAPVESVDERSAGPGVVDQVGDAHVRGRRLASGRDLDPLSADLRREVECLLEAEVSDRIRVQPDFH